MANRNPDKAGTVKTEGSDKATVGTMISAKVSEKKAVSVYMTVKGRRSRFPTTLYADQWLAILDRADALRKFIEAHKGELASEATPEAKPVTGATAL